MYMKKINDNIMNMGWLLKGNQKSLRVLSACHFEPEYKPSIVGHPTGKPM